MPKPTLLAALVLTPLVASAQEPAGEKYVEPRDRYELVLPVGWTHQPGHEPDQTILIGDGLHVTVTVCPARWGATGALDVAEDGLRRFAGELERLSTERHTFQELRAETKTYRGRKLRVPPRDDVDEAYFFVGAVQLPHAVIMISSTVLTPDAMDGLPGILAAIRPHEKPGKPKKAKKKKKTAAEEQQR